MLGYHLLEILQYTILIGTKDDMLQEMSDLDCPDLRSDFRVSICSGSKIGRTSKDEIREMKL